MINKDILNDIAKWSLILGVVMSISRIVEYKIILSGDVSQFVMLAVEWPASIAAYAFIAYRANKKRVLSLPKWVAYPLGVAINYTITISVFAAVIVGVCSHIFVMSPEVGGYEALTERSIDAMRSVVEQSNLPESTAEVYDDMFAKAQSSQSDVQRSPSMFSSIFSMVANYILSGFFIGLIVGLFVKRKAQVADIINDVDDKETKNE